MEVSGTSPDGVLAEIIELKKHPFYIAVQYHPEFKSKPTAPQPIFAAFINAAVERRRARAEKESKAAAEDRQASTSKEEESRSNQSETAG